jgi:GAF domain-containing protein
MTGPDRPAGDPVARDAAAVAEALSVALAPVGEDLVSWTARTARAVFGAAACSIALLTDDGAELVFTTSSGGSPDITGLRLPAGEGIAGWVATTGQPLAVDDLERDPRFAASFASSTGFTPSAILAAPIELDDRLLGVIEVLDRDSGRAGSDEDLALLTLFGRQAAVALDATARSRRIGELLARALQRVDGGDGEIDLSAALREDRADGLGELAAAFADLAVAGSRERALATSLLSSVAGFARARR